MKFTLPKYILAKQAPLPRSEQHVPPSRVGMRNFALIPGTVPALSICNSFLSPQQAFSFRYFSFTSAQDSPKVGRRKAKSRKETAMPESSEDAARGRRPPPETPLSMLVPPCGDLDVHSSGWYARTRGRCGGLRSRSESPRVHQSSKSPPPLLPTLP